MNVTFTLNKRSAAVRQAITAIKLYFEDDDEVSIHTLAGASYNLFKDLAKAENTTPMLFKQAVLKLIDEKHHKMWLAEINRIENYLKHADKDYDKEIEFSQNSTEILLLDICLKLKEIGNYPFATTFLIWYTITHPGIIPTGVDVEFLNRSKEYSELGRKEYFKVFFPLSDKYKNLKWAV